MSLSTRSRATVADRPPGRPAVPVGYWAAALAGAWVTPLVTHLIHADWLLPPVVLVGVMALQRGGHSLPDRLVLAVAQLFGALCVAGLLITVWPWGLHPVPIAGTALTALLGIAAATGRRPHLPIRLPPGDRAVWLASLVVAVLAGVPFALRDLGARIGIVATGEDMARHFLIYDMIGNAGGYAFMQRSVPAGYGTGSQDYPQATHLLYAVLDRFARSADRNADGVTAMDALLWCHFGTYVFFALAVLWAARRVGGPGPAAAALLPVLAGVAAVLYFGDLITPFLRGYPNELLGLALVAILTAVLARPLSAPREQIVTVAALLIGVSFTYHLYLPYAVVVAAAWAWTARRTVRRHPWVLGAACAFLPLALVTPVANRPTGAGNLLLIPGTAFPADRPVLAVVLLVALAGLRLRQGLRSPSRRMLAFAIGTASALVLALLAYQFVMVGHSVYYFEKLLHMLLVVAVVALGSAARLLPRVRLGGPGALRRLAPSLAAAVVAVGFVAGFGGPWHNHLLSGYGVRYGSGIDKGSPVGGREAVAITRAYPDGGGKANVVLGRTPYANFYATLFAAAMQRNYRVGAPWYLFLSPSAARTLADLDEMVKNSPVPVRLFVQNPNASFLVLDDAHPRRPVPGPGVDPAAYGEPGAMTNLEAAEYLAGRYPDRVEVVREP